MLFELTLLATFALQHLLIGGLLLVALSVIIRSFEFSVELRSWLWATAFVVSTIAPFSSLVPGEAVRVQLVSVNESTLSDERSLPAQPETFAIMARTENEKRLQWNVPSSLVSLFAPIYYLFLLVWLIGSCWRFACVRRSFVATKTIVSTSEPLDYDFSSVSESLRLISVRSSGDAISPMAVGLFRPVILIPNSFLEDLAGDDLSPIVLHECAHVRRRDLWVGLFQECLAIVFWWSPVMRMLNRKIHVSRELACDAWAARALADRKRYAQSLIDCAHLMLERRSNVLAMGLFSKKKELTFRVNEVLKMNIHKRTKTIIAIVSCVLVSAGTILIADGLAPQVNLNSVRRESNHFSELSRTKGELLMEAIRDGDQSMLEFMIANGLDINTPIKGDGTALIVAVKYGNREMVEALINLGADVNQSARGDGNPLIAAAMYNRLKLAEFLVQHGAMVDAVVEDDETPLINASHRGYFDMVKFLVKNGADVNLGVTVNRWSMGGSSTEYRSPLSRAGSSEIREYLLSRGAVN